jgi:diaminopimelate decarboxylase
MRDFPHQQGQLYAESIPVATLATEFGTPLYIYSRAAIEKQWLAFNAALANQPHHICYAVKANSNLAVLNILARLGSGFDIVSLGELERVLAAGGLPDKIVFSGVGKLAVEIERALAVGIACFNVESKPELERLSQIAINTGKTAKFAIRVNPDIDARTHPYISTGLKENKFGIASEDVLALYAYAKTLPNLTAVGIACHIGSQLMELEPFMEAFDKIYHLYIELKNRGIILEQLDLGGGLGVCYRFEQPPALEDYGAAILSRLPDKQLRLILEPGRAIVANAGILVTRVEYLKPTAHRHFAIVDAAMNDLLRPALYQAQQEIEPVQVRSNLAAQRYDVVGPVCETGDFLAKDRQLAILPGDLLAIRSAGAYGFVMSSNYNSRPKAAEVMVDGDQAYLIRSRETIAELFAEERMLP